MKMPTLHKEIDQCIENCQKCHQVCLETIAYCLNQGGIHANPEHILLLENCAEICQVSADFMIRGSGLHPKLCAVCAAVCERCAQDCASISVEGYMLLCIEECRRCAQSCREMSRMEHG